MVKELDELEASHSLAQVKQMAMEKGVSVAGTKREIATRLLALEKTAEKKESGAFKVPQWPEVKEVFVGGCVKRGVGSSFRARAHAHNLKGNEYFGWICVRSFKRVGETKGDVITKPSGILWHEYAHILTPNHPHDDTWRRKMKDLGLPITEQYRKKPKTRITYKFLCPSCQHRWEGPFTWNCPKCGKSGLMSTRKE